MQDLFFYLNWRGDISFYNAPFNAVDNILFCGLAYLKLDDFFNDSSILTIEEVYKHYRTRKIKGSAFYKKSEKLLEAVAKSNRFKNVKVARYKRINDEKIEKQFGAMTFLLPDNTLLVTFSGTDETVVGWKEDFNLSYLSVIPAQLEAKKYLEETFRVSKKNIFVAGHSKGGNLAMYAAIFCEDAFKERIIKVYNNDGPGLKEEVFKTTSFLKIKEKIITYLPKFSIVGYLFYNETTIQFIESYEYGILEHDLFSWKIAGTEFVRVANFDLLTKHFVDQLNQKLKKMPKEKQKKIIQSIFAFFDIFHIKSFEEINEVFTKLPNFIKTTLSFDEEQDFFQVFAILMQIFKLLS